jgi:hypothetical protein
MHQGVDILIGARPEQVHCYSNGCADPPYGLLFNETPGIGQGRPVAWWTVNIDRHCALVLPP